MSLVELKMYTVECDHCKEHYESDEFSGWTDAGTAQDNAIDDGWFRGEDDGKFDGKHYCSACATFDDDDEDEETVILDPERKDVYLPVPKEIKRYAPDTYGASIHSTEETAYPKNETESTSVWVGILQKWQKYRYKGFYSFTEKSWYIQRAGAFDKVPAEKIDCWFYTEEN